jgi:hypothetical protein
MPDAIVSDSPQTPTAESVSAAPTPSRWNVTFTDDGCRTEVRLGALIILIAVFLWLWFGPATSAKIFMCGVPFLLVGIPVQAIQALRYQRPGYPWKLGLAMTFMGLAMWHDLRFREWPGDPVRVLDVAPMLTAAGGWILLWWPIARLGRRAAVAAA